MSGMKNNMPLPCSSKLLFITGYKLAVLRGVCFKYTNAIKRNKPQAQHLLPRFNKKAAP
jgi:hypothetical protein